VILVPVAPLLANAGDLAPPGLSLVLYVIALVLPFVLTRLRLVKASRWGRFMDRQLRWVWLFVGVLVGQFLFARWGMW
jgi:cytochrome c biogenesis protein CcdA